MGKLKFQKMWGAHSMGTIWGEFIANNFSNSNKYRKDTGIHESNVVFYYHKNVGTEFYNAISEMNDSAKIGKERFSNPEEVKNYIKNAKIALEKSNKVYFDVLYNDLSNLTTKKIFESFRFQLLHFNEIYSYFHACQPQYFSEIESNIKDYLDNIGIIEDVSDAVGTLTTIEDFDVVSKEELEWLEIVKEIQKRGLNHDSLKNDEQIVSRLNCHTDKYMSLGSGEGGKPWDQEYFLELLKGFQENADEKIRQIRTKKQQAIKQKILFIEKNKISDNIVQLTDAVGKIGFLRLELRLGWMRLSHTSTNTLIELSKNINDSDIANNIFDFKISEIENILEKKGIGVSRIEINNRKKSFLFMTHNGELEFFSGDDAIKEKNKIIPEEDTTVSEIRGSVACRGLVEGRVYVIDWNNKNLTKRMNDMKEGSILVAGQTRPQLMPAIRKARAIITDEGGITSHAAIISRELGIPCVIGTKIATKVLKDGDMVEVDANIGVIKIFK